jgi:hypothetical protein
MCWRMDGGMCKDFGITIFRKVFIFLRYSRGLRRLRFLICWSTAMNSDFVALRNTCNTLQQNDKMLIINYLTTDNILSVTKMCHHFRANAVARDYLHSYS